MFKSAGRNSRLTSVWCARGQADVHAQNKYERTPLHYAAMEGNYVAALMLLKAGAAPDHVWFRACYLFLAHCSRFFFCSVSRFFSVFPC